MTLNLKNTSQENNHTFIKKQMKKNINIKYQCVIFIQFCATESDITVVVVCFLFLLIIQIMNSIVYTIIKPHFIFSHLMYYGYLFF